MNNRRTKLIQKIHGKYGSQFGRRQYDISEKTVDKVLPAKEISKEKQSIAGQLRKEPQRKEWPNFAAVQELPRAMRP